MEKYNHNDQVYDKYVDYRGNKIISSTQQSKVIHEIDREYHRYLHVYLIEFIKVHYNEVLVLLIVIVFVVYSSSTFYQGE